MGGEIIPIDGKTIRGDYDRNQNKSALHVISAWASEQSLVLAQMKVEDKSNEITTIPALLELLDILAPLSLLMQWEPNTKQIIGKKVIVCLGTKANHPTLYQVTEWFETALANNFLGIDVSYDKRLEKDIIAPKFVRFGLYRCCYSSALSTQTMGRFGKIWSSVRHLWNKTT